MTLAGLEAVFLAHREALLRFLRARGAGDDAEDLLQDLWFRVAAAPTGPIAEPVGYLMRAANNLMLDRARGATRAMQRDLAWSEAAAHEAPSAERTLIGRDALSRTEQTLAALGLRTEAIFRRYRLDDVTIDQVAREFGVSRSTVEKDLQKAYRALLALKGSDDA